VRHIYFRHFEDFKLPQLSTRQHKAIADRLDAADSAVAEGKNHKARPIELRTPSPTQFSHDKAAMSFNEFNRVEQILFFLCERGRSGSSL
jgi:hypothetical protein